MAPPWAQLDLNPNRIVFRTWQDWDGNMYYGTLNKETGKEDGVIKKIEPGIAMSDYQASDGKRHGIFFRIKANAQY